jgi:hypothetical protein
MENKKTKHSYNGLQQDITSSQYQPNFYFDGRNIRINATNSQSTNSVTNEKGNSLILTIPVPTINYDTKIISYDDKTLSYSNDEIDYEGQSENQVIIGHSNSRKYIILFTTDNAGFDCIWKVDYETYEITLLYLRNLKFSINNPIQTINNFENENIDKVYWVDGINQMRFINIEHSIENQDLEELIDISQNVIDMVGKTVLSQPIITEVITGGSHTSGMIQYAYNLYRLNSSQSKLSPVSKLVSLDKESLGGGALNEVVGATPIIDIINIDPNYTNIKVYSIKYTSLNQTPVISLIEDSEIPSTGNIEIFDDGAVISTLSLEEFIFLGSDIIIPKHINSKFNRLFFANYSEINFDINLDTRAYSYNSAGISTVYSDLRLEGGVPSGDPEKTINIINDLDYDSLILDKHDSVNLNYSVFKYQKDGVTFGGEGKYIKYQLTQSLTFNANNKYFKDEEIYRIGIIFYNSYGQFSTPNWIADFRALNGNLEGKYNTLKVTLKPEFFTWLSTYNFLSEYDIPAGYKIVIAERTLNDKTIIASGLLSTMMINHKSTEDIAIDYLNADPSKIPTIRTQGKLLPKLPNILVRNCNEISDWGNVRPLRKSVHMRDMCLTNTSDTEVQRARYGDVDTMGRFYQFNSMLQLYSPEIIFGESTQLSESVQLRIKGSLTNHINNSWAKTYDTPTGNPVFIGKALNGLSPYYSQSYSTELSNAFPPYEKGLVGLTRGESPNKTVLGMYYRNYGVPAITNSSTIDTITLNNLLILTSGTDPDSLITLNEGGRKITVLLNDTHQDGNASYTITPSGAYLSTIYNIRLTSDYQGNNTLVSLIGVTGIQTLAYPMLLTTASTNDIYLIIETASIISGTIDLTVGVSNTTIITYDTLGNPFTVDNATTAPTSLFKASPNSIKYSIYGKPEITEKGQGGTNYNNDPTYRYINSLESCLTDGDTAYKDSGTFGRKIVSVNSYGARCLTMVTGTDSPSEEHWDRPSIESIFSATGLTGDNNGLIGELVKSDVEIYLGNIYGGNSYEDKTRTNYIEIGDYRELNSSLPSIDINSPGDTFVNSFKFTRIVKTDTSSINNGIYTLEEIVECLTETTIDLKNRNDISLGVWDSKFQPSYDEYHKYNKVYSQIANLIQHRGLNYNIRRLDKFDTNIITTKLKSAGELIDNWTDILPNEIMTLDGKHGPINNLASFNDELYTIQDKAFAFLSINPRVQITGGDGLAVQLGTGSVLDQYKYISTESGTLNKWSVIPTPQGIYYYDLFNKSFNMFKGQIGSLSDIKGLHSYFINNTELESLKIDNPLIKQGISSGYDSINKDIFMTFHNDEKSFTISYNESRNQFISFYDYLPSMYISKGQYFITTNPNLKSIYRQYAGNYNNFYGINYPSYIILNINPEANLDTVFDNIMYKSEVYLNDIDQPDKTLTKVRLYNEYQDSGLIPLTVGRNSNLRRKFRDWNAILPRNQGSRERIRNPWVKLLLQFDNNSNYKLILHDVIISYSV